MLESSENVVPYWLNFVAWDSDKQANIHVHVLPKSELQFMVVHFPIYQIIYAMYPYVTKQNGCVKLQTFKILTCSINLPSFNN